MKSRFCFFSKLVVLLFLGNTFAFATENRSLQNETPFQIFETQVYPFLQQKCAGCHGDNQFDAPQHSPRNDAQTSYQKIRGYVHIAPDWESTSRLITFGGTRHCKEYTGDDSCGADHNELISTVRNWIDAEIYARAEAPQKQIRSAKNMLPPSQKQIINTENADTQAKRSLKIIQISAGGFHTCALFENGKAKCWGANDFGQLGIDNSSDLAGKTLAEMAQLPYVMIQEPIQQIAAGNTHTCALLQNGKAKCWGRNVQGQLGIGSSKDLVGRTSQEMNSLPYVMINGPIKQIVAGDTHTCALLQNGKAKCWGSNTYGQLGVGLKIDLAGKTSQEMDGLANVMIDEPIKQISLGSEHSCALLQNGKVKCWGSNFEGQLGIGLQNISFGRSLSEMILLPDVILDAADEPVLQISAGSNHTCALLQHGKAKCWGYNEHGQLGVKLNARNIGKSQEGMQSLSYASISEPIQQIATGRYYSCALLQNEKNTARCWGNNIFGQLAAGSQIPILSFTLQGATTPSPILFQEKILQISATFSHTCFLLENNKIKCAGRNSEAQLGTGDIIDRGTLDLDGTDELSDALVSAEEE